MSSTSDYLLFKCVLLGLLKALSPEVEALGIQALGHHLLKSRNAEAALFLRDGVEVHGLI